MKTKIFTPVESMNPTFLGFSDNLCGEILNYHEGSTLAEIKEDGYRMQVHKKGGEIRAYTRSMNTIHLDLFPELKKSLSNLPDCILDSELTGYGKIGHEGFSSIQKRFRHKISQEGLENYLSSGLVEELPVSLKVFDVLHWENKSLVDSVLTERRKYTEGILEEKIVPSTARLISRSEDLENWFKGLVGEHYEGLVCKKPSSIYTPGKEATDWIKLKRSETLDLALLGVYMSSGQISQALCGTYNPEKGVFETLAKVNAKREGMNKELKRLIEGNSCLIPPKNVIVNDKIYRTKNAVPDLFIKPEKSVVLEIAAMNFYRGSNWHSCGLENGEAYSLRIGWLKSIRQDKTPYQASTPSKLKVLYESERSAQ